MRPRWDEMARVATADVVAMYRNSFRRDTERDGGLQLLVDLQFAVNSVRIDGDVATIDGCVHQIGVVERVRDRAELGRSDENLQYAGELERGGVMGWRFRNVSVGEQCGG
ncbi:MAG: hypothetical protein ACOYNI_08980 [Acidimicrobiia bacterium]